MVLTPLATVLDSLMLGVDPVELRIMPLRDAVGRALAADVTADSEQAALRLAGAPLRRIDLAGLAALGIESVSVRAPRARIAVTRSDPAVAAIAALIGSAVVAEGGDVAAGSTTLDEALAASDVDFIIAVGGGGSRDNNDSVATLVRRGRVAFHGIGILPGEATAFGYRDAVPVLLLPGELGGALAAWLTLGRRVLARLAFRLIEAQPFTAELARPIVSPPGFAEVVPVRRRADKIEPLASGHLSPQVLAPADGWILVPAESEGFTPGTRLAVRPWP